MHDTHFIRTFLIIFLFTFPYVVPLTSNEYFKSTVKSMINNTLRNPSTQCERILYSAYLNTTNDDGVYKRLLNSSSLTKNDISSYYSCIRNTNEFNYYILSIFPNNTQENGVTYPKINLHYENQHYKLGLCLVKGCTHSEIAEIFTKVNNDNNNIFFSSNSLATSIDINENINIFSTTDIIMTTIILIIISTLFIFVVFNSIPKMIFKNCFKYKAPTEPQGEFSSETPWRAPVQITGINKYKLYNFTQCFNLHDNIKAIFHNSSIIMNDDGMGYIKGLRAISIIFSLFGISYLQLMSYSLKQYEINKYKSSLVSPFFILINVEARYMPRIMFSLSGFAAIYKMLCFLDDRLSFTDKERAKRRSSELTDIDKLSGGFGKVFIPETKDESELQIVDCVLFIGRQMYKFIIAIFVALFIKYSLFNIFRVTNLSGAALIMYKEDYVDYVSVWDILGHFIQILNFYFFEGNSDNKSNPLSEKCIMPLMWLVINEFFFFIITAFIIFLLFKHKKNILTAISILIVVFIIIRIAMFSLLDHNRTYSTLFAYIDSDFGLFNLNPLCNYSYYLIGGFFGVLNYVVQKVIEDTKTNFNSAKSLVELLKYQNKCLFYIIITFLSIIAIFASSFQQIFLWIYYLSQTSIVDTTVDLQNYFENILINYFYLFDSDIVVAIVHYICFVLFIKGYPLFTKLLSSHKWSLFSRIYFPFILYCSIIMVFVYYKSETNIPLAMHNVYIYGTISFIILFVVVIVHCVFVEFPLKRVTGMIIRDERSLRKKSSM